MLAVVHFHRLQITTHHNHVITGTLLSGHPGGHSGPLLPASLPAPRITVLVVVVMAPVVSPDAGALRPVSRRVMLARGAPRRPRSRLDEGRVSGTLGGCPAGINAAGQLDVHVG